MANDVTKETIEKIEKLLDGQLTQEEIKDIIYSAYSYSTAIGENNVNDIVDLMHFIDWKYYIEKKTVV